MESAFKEDVEEFEGLDKAKKIQYLTRLSGYADQFGPEQIRAGVVSLCLSCLSEPVETQEDRAMFYRSAEILAVLAENCFDDLPITEIVDSSAIPALSATLSPSYNIQEGSEQNTDFLLQTICMRILNLLSRDASICHEIAHSDEDIAQWIVECVEKGFERGYKSFLRRPGNLADADRALLSPIASTSLPKALANAITLSFQFFEHSISLLSNLTSQSFVFVQKLAKVGNVWDKLSCMLEVPLFSNPQPIHVLSTIFKDTCASISDLPPSFPPSLLANQNFLSKLPIFITHPLSSANLLVSIGHLFFENKNFSLEAVGGEDFSCARFLERSGGAKKFLFSIFDVLEMHFVDAREISQLGEKIISLVLCANDENDKTKNLFLDSGDLELIQMEYGQWGSKRDGVGKTSQEEMLHKRAMSAKDHGNSLFKGRQIDRALLAYQEGLAFCPIAFNRKDRQALHNNLSECHLQIGNHEECVRSATRALFLEQNENNKSASDKALTRRIKGNLKMKNELQALLDLTMLQTVEGRSGMMEVMGDLLVKFSPYQKLVAGDSETIRKIGEAEREAESQIGRIVGAGVESGEEPGSEFVQEALSGLESWHGLAAEPLVPVFKYMLKD